MIRKPVAVILFLLLVSMSSLCSAEIWEMDLSAGPTSLTGGLHYKQYLDTGYLRVGGTGVYTDDDDTNYKWGSFDFTVGSDTLIPGMTLDVGLRGILGKAEDSDNSGDVGAVGFTSNAGYLFSRDVFPIPLEVFGGLTWAPAPLAFMDTDNYFEANLGVGLRVIKNASIIASYSYYHLKMESGSSDWHLDDNVFRAGLLLRF
jgi:hypothetical protein